MTPQRELTKEEKEAIRAYAQHNDTSRLSYDLKELFQHIDFTLRQCEERLAESEKMRDFYKRLLDDLRKTIDLKASAGK